MSTQRVLERPPAAVDEVDPDVDWLAAALPRVFRRLNESEGMESPLLQLPLAQLRLAQALFSSENPSAGETMSRLSARLGVRMSALTQSADRLIGQGMAERLSDPHDRRVVRLRLTRTGHECIAARHARRRATIRRMWDLIAPADRPELVYALRVLERATSLLETVTPERQGPSDPLASSHNDIPTPKARLAPVGKDR